MKLYVDRDDKNNITLAMSVESVKQEFQYPKFVERLYDNDLPEPIEFSEKILPEEQIKLQAMLDEIVSVAKKKSYDTSA